MEKKREKEEELERRGKNKKDKERKEQTKKREKNDSDKRELKIINFRLNLVAHFGNKEKGGGEVKSSNK